MSSHEHVAKIVDVTSIFVAVGTLASWLPPLAALFTIVWTATRIYEAIAGRPFSQSDTANALRRLLRIRQ